jgi:hypothetical protein
VELLDLVANLNEIFSPIIFTQFLVNAIMICVIGFEIVMAESFIGKIFPAIFGTAVVIQLFIYAFGGQLVIDKSDAVGKDLYENDRDFLIINARPLKQTKVASPFFSVDLPTFVSIMNSAWSLIATLQNFV